MSIQAGSSRHWSLEEIPYGSIDRQRARADPHLLYLVAGASFVEITSDLYASNLAEYFIGDRGLTQWLRERWEPEEKQHGLTLRRYVETVWAELDREDTYYASKHVFQALHPAQRFTPVDHRRIKRRYARLARRHYPYRTAAWMLLTPLRLSPILQSTTTPLLAFAGWLLVP
ncbi:MAG: hypothetical protein LJE70_05890 [Chromatiaceae bacterium]|nr:hypothetical protein [Chromatiaceae bacterium]